MGVQVLNNRDINQRIIRLAYEIYEHNAYESEIFILGINTNGYNFGVLLKEALMKISPLECTLTRLVINPAAPTEQAIQLEIEKDRLEGSAIVMVDDVANTGRTMFYACQAIMDIIPKTLEFAVLVDRKHKSFPVHVSYVGLSLATTLQEHINVSLEKEAKFVSLH